MQFKNLRRASFQDIQTYNLIDQSSKFQKHCDYIENIIEGDHKPHSVDWTPSCLDYASLERG